jgi:SAM-dependent methyltransferase
MKEHDIRPAALLDDFFTRLQRDAARLAVKRSAFVDVPCPFCGGGDSDDAIEKEGFSYRSCRDCGSLFASPRPTAELLREYMTTSEAVELWSTHFYRATAEARRAQMFRPRAARIAAIADRHGVPSTGICADIGAGYGLFLLELKALGRFTKLLAIEPDARLAAVCRGHGFEVLERWIEDPGATTVNADLATAFEVLEHVFDPLEFLTASVRAVRPGGLLFFSTLAVTGFDIQTLWAQSRSVSPPQHLNFPSIAGVERLLARAGLEAVEITTPGELDVDIVRNRLAADPDLDVPRFARLVAGASDDTRGAFQQFLKAQRLSSHLQCVARRPAP